MQPTDGPISLPHDFSLAIPDGGLAWLWSNNITDTEIERFGIGYSKSLHRVILPVYQDGELVYWQGRYFDRDRPKDIPKYINVKSKRPSVYFKREDFPSKDEVVLVEDILSAIAVGRVTNAWALLNAHVSDATIGDAKQYTDILIWLDADKSSYCMQRVRHYRSLGYKCIGVYTTSDPKCYEPEEITELLYGGH